MTGVSSLRSVGGGFSSAFAINGWRGRREAWEKFLLPFELLPIDAEAAWHYGDQHRALASRGELIGSNDLWIAATALAHELPLATGKVQ